MNFLDILAVFGTDKIGFPFPVGSPVHTSSPVVLNLKILHLDEMSHGIGVDSSMFYQVFSNDHSFQLLSDIVSKWAGIQIYYCLTVVHTTGELYKKTNNIYPCCNGLNDISLLEKILLDYLKRFLKRPHQIDTC